MLRKTNFYYIISFLLLESYFFTTSSNKYLLINFVNFLFCVSFSGFMLFYFNQSENYFDKLKLAISVFIFTLIFVFLFNFISFVYEGNYFVFSTGDALTYDYQARQLVRNDSFVRWQSILLSSDLDDMGAPLFIGFVYLFIESNLLLNFVYVILGMFTSQKIYNISLNFLSKKYSFITAFAFSTSSFLIWYNSSGLKESLMLFIVVAFFEQYYQYTRKKRIKNLVSTILFGLSMFFFRIPMVFMLFASIGLSAFISVKKNTFLKIVTISSAIIFLVFVSLLEMSYNRYFSGGISQMIVARESEGMIVGSLFFTYTVNILSQLIGPLTTIIPDQKSFLAFFHGGLLYRIILAFPFFLGVYYSIIKKNTMIYPMIIYVFFEMFSLSFILEGLELRKSLMHLPFIYIVAFWFLEYFHNIKSKLSHKILFLFRLSFLVSFIIVFYWNLRFA